jgi:hypothetical protein
MVKRLAQRSVDGARGFAGRGGRLLRVPAHEILPGVWQNAAAIWLRGLPRASRSAVSKASQRAPFIRIRPAARTAVSRRRIPGCCSGPRTGVTS